MKKLLLVQAQLVAPKNQLNAFGKYKYRNAEDILEAVKPLLLKHDCTLTISDDMVQVGDRYYIKSTCSFSDGENTKTVTAFARESLDFKGMSEAQITGATSSYARKYALNGLFLIDDNKDPDYYDNSQDDKTSKSKQSSTPETHATNQDYATTIKNASTMKEVEDIWYKHTSLQGDPKFIEALRTRKEQLKQQ